MGKKDKKAKREEGGNQISPEPISPFGKKVILGGVGVILLGFFVLSLADPMGRNWAARLAPFLILGGYALVGLGIFMPDSGQSQDPSRLPPAS